MSIIRLLGGCKAYHFPVVKITGPLIFFSINAMGCSKLYLTSTDNLTSTAHQQLASLMFVCWLLVLNSGPPRSCVEDEDAFESTEVRALNHYCNDYKIPVTGDEGNATNASTTLFFCLEAKFSNQIKSSQRLPAMAILQAFYFYGHSV